jgi:methylphosphotriester-DNA--protein-cysteine methyltransferase
MRLVETPDPAAKLRLLRDALLEGAPRVLAWHPAVSHALAAFERAPHRMRVAQVAREADISHRRFIAMFTNEVGLTPKTYLRIARF